jgi:uncharacterized protein DUF3309
MSLLWLLVVVLLIMAVFGAPHWSYAQSWGWGPSGAVSILVIVLIVLLLTGRL